MEDLDEPLVFSVKDDVEIKLPNLQKNKRHFKRPALF